jgi:hypothetical protein
MMPLAARFQTLVAPPLMRLAPWAAIIAVPIDRLDGLLTGQATRLGGCSYCHSPEKR